MARLIRIDNTKEHIKPGDEWFTVDEMCTYVGGFFEAIQVTPSQVMYFNENGQELGLSINMDATQLLHQYRPHHAAITLFGNVVMASLQETGDA